MDKKIKEKIFKKAFSLEQYGVNGFAWSKKEALIIVNLIMNEKTGILGGDIYRLISDRLEPLYDNWSCEPGKDELQENYYLRSKTESLRYIKNYPIHSKEKIIFSIIFTEKIT